MLSDDWRDGLFATIGLIALIFVGTFLNFGAANISVVDAPFNDDIELALLNTLRAGTVKGDVANIIALNEIDENYFTMVKGIIEQNLNFAFRDKLYFLKITYPSGKKIFISPSIDLGITGEENFEAGRINVKKVAIPSLNNGMIEVELVVKNE